MAIPAPAVRRTTLIRSAGVVWTGVGIYLSIMALLWFRASSGAALPLALLALGLGFVKGRFIFSKLARRNIERIGELAPHKDKICLFAFQAWESYAVIAAMMSLGIILRHSRLSRESLAVVYLAIGTALLYGSGPYWRGRRA